MSWRELLGVAVSAALLIAAEPSPPPEVLDYTVSAVSRKLVRERPEGDERLVAGALARSGELLRTGWWSQAELEVAARGSRFRLGSSTRVRLAHEHPALLLEVQEGSVRALFEPLGEDAERLVLTPSAVLAVRGTDYGVEVARDGTTTLAVFEGVVEVADRFRAGEPIRVEAGQSTRVRPGRAAEPPRSHELRGEQWDRGRRPPDPDRGGGGSPGLGPGEAPGGQPGQPGGAQQPPQQQPGQQQGGSRKGKG